MPVPCCASAIEAMPTIGSRRPASTTWRACRTPSRCCSRTRFAMPPAPSGLVSPSDARAGVLESDAARRGRAAVHAGARDPAGLHRRPVRRRPGRHARRGRGDGRRSISRQSAGACRPGDRPQRAGRPVRLRVRLRRQRRARVRAQWRALRPAALGAAGLRQLPGRAARDGDRAPGQPGVPGRRGDRAARSRRRAGRLPRHAGRHRLAHDHDQRPGRRRLGRRRHRGRGGAPGPAALPADAGGGRLPPRRRAARRRHRHRPGAVRDRDAAQPRRGRQVRRVPRPRPVAARAGGSRHDQQHVAGVRRHRDPLPDRRRDAPLPAHDRPIGRDGGSRRGVRQDTGPLPHRCHRRAAVQRVAEARPGKRRAVGRRAAASAGSRAADRAAPLLSSRVRRWAAAARPGRRGERGVVPGQRPARLHRGDGGARHRAGPGPVSRKPRHGVCRLRRGKGRQAVRAALRLGGDRRHHVMHQHEQPERHGRRGARCP